MLAAATGTGSLLGAGATLGALDGFTLPLPPNEARTEETTTTQRAVTATPPFVVVMLNRMGFGPRGADQADFKALGSTDAERLANYVDQQLEWQAIDDPEVEARLAITTSEGPAYKTLDKTLAQMWQDHDVDGNDRYAPIYEMERAAFVRAVYSKRQLLEFLADFWHNHFNIYGRDTYARSTYTSWDRDVIRPPVAGHPRPAGLEHGHLMGNFRQMLELTSKHPAMIYYLDNYVNGRADPNENYAREIIELHTLGAINYAGPNPQPGDINTISMPEFPGVPINDKYSDADVYEAMRFLTGWNVEDGNNPYRINGGEREPDTGQWYFYEGWHDQLAKGLLGKHWDAFSGISEVYEMLDLLAYHPGTAQYIALKLCQRFLSENPPQTLVDKVAATFYAKRHDADQLKETYRTLLTADEFMDTGGWPTKLKRPFETIVSAMRACDANFNIRRGDSESNSFMYYIDRTGQRPFGWHSPDGYPDKASFWEGGASLVHTWRTLDWLVDENVGRDDPDLMPVTDITLNELTKPHTPNRLAAFWLARVLKWIPSGGWEGTAVHQTLVEFLQERPDDDPSPWPADYPIEDISENSWPYYWNERLRGMVKLIFATPEFMQR